MNTKKMSLNILYGTCIILFLVLSTSVSAEITVRVLNIGQGDAILLESGDEWMLFDAGPRDATVDLLQKYGVTHLNYFLTSHPDADHIGGAAAVINAFPIDHYADSGATHSTKIYENMIAALVKKEVGYSEVKKGDKWTLGDAEVEVMSSGDGSSTNERSVVLHITDGDVTFLLPGDKEDIKKWEAKILVVPHHGSAGIHFGSYPEVALISVGLHNKYGHPTQETLNRLESADVQIYRTDQNGTITVVSDGQNYTIQTEYDSTSKQQSNEIEDGDDLLQKKEDSTSSPSIEPDFTLRVLDIGQGDAILLESEDEWMLFDAGPQARTVDLLQQYGVTHLDYFVTSHPDADHIGGAAAVINSFPIGTYADSGAVHTTKIYENMMTSLVKEKVTYAELVSGDSWTLGNVIIDVLSAGEGSNNNDKSVVLRITHDDITFLLPGDKEDLKKWDTKILVAPHHGSAGLHLGKAPEVALISVGQHNKYGHPAQATLDFFESSGTKVYRTDLDGTITVLSDGKKYVILTENEANERSEKEREVQTDEIDETDESDEIEGESTLKNKESPCDCSGNRLSCGSFANWEDAQACYLHCLSLGKGDIYRLDLNKDGLACDSLRKQR